MIAPPVVNLAPRGDLTRQGFGAFPLKVQPRCPPLDWAGVLAAFAVEKSVRYYPYPGHTFCNVYAYDFAAAFGLWVPRVWWMDSELEKIMAGIPASTPRYGANIREMTANDLFSWFGEWGAAYGWERIDDDADLQARVDRSERPGIIVGRRIGGGHGHITACIPSRLREGAVTGFGTPQWAGPVQSEAGRVPRRVSQGRWWLKGHEVGFYFPRG